MLLYLEMSLSIDLSLHLLLNLHLKVAKGLRKSVPISFFSNTQLRTFPAPVDATFHTTKVHPRSLLSMHTETIRALAFLTMQVFQRDTSVEDTTAALRVVDIENSQSHWLA